MEETGSYPSPRDRKLHLQKEQKASLLEEMESVTLISISAISPGIQKGLYTKFIEPGDNQNIKTTFRIRTEELLLAYTKVPHEPS